MFSFANFLKSSLVALVVVGGVLGSSAPASAAKHVAKPAKPRTTNCLSNVCTRIILAYNNGTGGDVCFIHNSNNRPVTAYAAVSPTWPNGGVGTVGPINLGIFADQPIFPWIPGMYDWHTYKCLVTSVK